MKLCLQSLGLSMRGALTACMFARPFRFRSLKTAEELSVWDRGEQRASRQCWVQSSPRKELSCALGVSMRFQQVGDDYQFLDPDR